MDKKNQNKKKKSINFKDLATKARSVVRNNYKLILLVIAMSIMSFLMVYCRMTELSIPLHSKRGVFAVVIFLIATVIMGLLLYWAKRKKWKIERIYLVFGLILGTIYCLVLPVGSVPDEPSHFWRVYGLAEGDLVMDECVTSLPTQVISLSQGQNFGSEAYKHQIDNVFVRPGEEYKQTKVSAHSYPPFNYMPQIVGVWVGKILQMPVIPMMIFCRMLNMIFCTLMVYLCIRYIPIFKKVVFLVAFFPMTMQLFASVSADGSIICAGMGLITYVLYARKSMKRKIGIWDFLLLLIICLTLTVAKPVYAFLCPIVFWIPKDRFKNIKWKIGFICLLGALTLAFVLAKIITAPLDANRFGSIDGQYDVILHDPVGYSMTLFGSSILEWFRYVSQTIGSSLEWFSVEIYDVYIMTFLLFFAFLCGEREMRITWNLRLFAFLAFVFIIVLTFTTLFVTWTIPGSRMIEGVQGRYFLPILLLIPLFCLPSTKSKNRNSRELVPRGYLYTFATLVNVYVATIIICYHI